MTRLFLAAAIGLAAAAMSVDAHAATRLTAPGVTSTEMTVAQGCGPGGHRNGYGRCVPNRPIYRRCPPGLHPGPYGRCIPNR